MVFGFSADWVRSFITPANVNHGTHNSPFLLSMVVCGYEANHTVMNQSATVKPVGKIDKRPQN